MRANPAHPVRDWPIWAQYALSLSAVLIALLIRLILEPTLGDKVPFITIFTVLLPLVLLVRPGPFLAAAVFGCAGIWYLIIPPRYSFSLQGAMVPLQILLYLMTAFAATLTAWLAERAHQRAERADVLLDQSLDKIKDLNRDLEKKVIERTEQLKKKEQELLQAMKLEAVGRLAGGVAHDFNNLLTGIFGISQDLQSQMAPDDPKFADLEEINKAVNRAFGMTKQLLAFGRKGVVQPQVLELNQNIVEINKLLRRLIGEDIELNLQLGDVGCIKIDPNQFEQVILNLAINARDAMPNGGTLILRTSEEELKSLNADTENHSVSAAPGRYVLLEVIDTGVGMPPDVLSHAFEPFFTTKGKDKGTGLGLATVYGIIQQSQGYIKIQSRVNEGTTFKVFFPKVSDCVTPTETLPFNAVPGGSESILVVEDEEIVRTVVIRRLRKKGYNVFEARNGKEALKIAQRQPIHLVLTDIVMPEMNGREMVTKLRELQPGVATLYMSGYPEDIIATKGILDAGIEYVEKNALMSILLMKVREVLDRPAVPSRN